MHTLSLRSLLEKEKLTGPNFLDWYRNLRIVLKHEKKSHAIENPLPEPPAATAANSVRVAYNKQKDEQEEVALLMLATMSSELQKCMETRNAFDMLTELKDMFQKQAHQELFDTTRAFHSCKMEEGQSVSSYVLKMKGYIEQLERLGSPVDNRLAISFILNSLTKAYDNFVVNFTMQGWDKSVGELHHMLKTAEQKIPQKTPAVLMIREGGVRKKKKAAVSHSGKGKGKKVAQKKTAPPSKKDHPAKDVECYHCGKIGHWRRNCPSYLAELKKGKAGQSSKSGINMID